MRVVGETSVSASKSVVCHCLRSHTQRSKALKHLFELPLKEAGEASAGKWFGFTSLSFDASHCDQGPVFAQNWELPGKSLSARDQKLLKDAWAEGILSAYTSEVVLDAGKRILDDEVATSTFTLLKS